MTQPEPDWSVTVAGAITPSVAGWWWVDELDCLVYLSGSGQLSAVAIARLTPPVELSATGTLTSAAYAIVPAAALLGGQGSLSSAAYAIVPAHAPLSAMGTLSVAALQQYRVAGALAGQGTLTAKAVQQYQKTVALGGAGTLSMAAIQRYLASLALGGAGTLSAAAIQQFRLAVALSGLGTLSAAAIQQFQRAGALAGAGSLSCAAAIASNAVTFDAVGAGGRDTTTGTTSWLHTVGAGALPWLFAVVFTDDFANNFDNFVNDPTMTVSSNVNGAFAFLGGVNVGFTNQTEGSMLLFGLETPAVGAHTISVDVVSAFTASLSVQGNSISYTSVGSIGTPVIFNQEGAGDTALALAVPSASGDTALGCAVFSAAETPTNLGQTARWNSGTTALGTGGDGLFGAFADAISLSTTTVNFTTTSTAHFCSGIGLNLQHP